MKTTHTNASEAKNRFKVRAYAASGAPLTGHTLKQVEIDRRDPIVNEVLIEILYCGVCHSDLHQVNNDWKNTIYPCVPGHEIIGKIVATGEGVTRFSIGQTVGVGCMIDSCGECPSCKSDKENYCLGPVGPTMTYNGYFTPDGSGFNTYGGYSTHVLSNQDFLLTIPDNLDIQSAAPILCAGITTYSPLKKYNVSAGQTVGVVGIGGLGHMGVKLAKAMGADVVAITTKEEKRKAAVELGADRVIVSENPEEMKAAELSLDFILVTIPYEFDVNPYVKMLKPDGTLITVGLLGPYKKPLDNMEAAKSGRTIGGSMIGGIKETQEVLDFCAEHGIFPETQLIDIAEINDALEKVKNEDARFRYVIDMQSLKQ